MKNYNPEKVSLYEYGGKFPSIAENVFIADGARIVGDVEIAPDCSVWYNAVIRGDVHHVRIGSRTNIQDNCILHVTHESAPLNLGNGITVGHGATLHGCTVCDYSLIGMGAIVLDLAVVESHCLVAAGAVVRPGTKIPQGSLVAGVPAKVVRGLREDEIADLHASADRYFNYALKSLEGIAATGKKIGQNN